MLELASSQTLRDPVVQDSSNKWGASGVYITLMQCGSIGLCCFQAAAFSISWALSGVVIFGPSRVSCRAYGSPMPICSNVRRMCNILASWRWKRAFFSAVAIGVFWGVLGSPAWVWGFGPPGYLLVWRPWCKVKLESLQVPQRVSAFLSSSLLSFLDWAGACCSSSICLSLPGIGGSCVHQWRKQSTDKYCLHFGGTLNTLIKSGRWKDAATETFGVLDEEKQVPIMTFHNLWMPTVLPQLFLLATVCLSSAPYGQWGQQPVSAQPVSI